MKKDFQDFKSVFSDFNFQSSSKKLLFSFLLFKCGLDLENDKVGMKTQRYLDSPHDSRHNARYLRWDEILSKWQIAELEKNSSKTRLVNKKSFGQLSFSSIGQIRFFLLFYFDHSIAGLKANYKVIKCQNTWDDKLSIWPNKTFRQFVFSTKSFRTNI